MDVVVAYDISTVDRRGRVRLRKVADICSKYGRRVQKSVFECRLSPQRHMRMIGELQDVIDWSEDTISIYHIYGDLGDSRMVLGIGDPPRELDDPWLV
ncbi:MAG: CRISPR-associated endonuclease Cas2 [Gammaproteobacteria bacterium]|nr:CRISPR-associated endonuclease Cas2 [bacterium]MYA38790.1 CRISPR-associated endonuclease Cas2 [Acidimicrobiia bacterium]MYC61201.1 CRISPR-associated endonuclease Cas2 [Gammaproteobacteria bacterium]MDE0675569.1 CRISPR-associated endonuclease Cas2 [bacterium]MYB79397.1 CRISPR-associated endonuclease Cas2 [Acidimicrobiia bacterium]